MESIRVNVDKIFDFIPKDAYQSLKDKMESCNRLLHDKSGKGNDFLGWVNLPSQISSTEIERINHCAEELKKLAEVVIVIGIGGSYLGAKAVLNALTSNFDYLAVKRDAPIVLFAGQNLSEDYAFELLEATKDRSIAAIVISKSGTTTEPAITFRIIKSEIEKRYGKSEASKRIVAVTDASRGALLELSRGEGYKTFVIPDDVGGRFSVLTPVGLLPLAVAGVNIDALVKGAVCMEKACADDVPFENNVAAQYAAARYALYNKGKKIEILASFEPKLQYLSEWWKQLYGESEGKEGKGLFPASVVFTSDLHSMGQYIQEGERILFETVIRVTNPKHKVVIEKDAGNLDQLNFLAGKRIEEVNKMAELGTMLAHVDGGVPNIAIEIECVDAENIGALLYFFEKACGISGYAIDVNPFDQPGVEAYKKNMFALLDKPGYEAEGNVLRNRL